MTAPNQPENRVRFDGTINLGHLLTFIGFGISAAVGWTTMDKRVVVLEQASVYQQSIDKKQDEEQIALKAQVREDYKDIANKLDRVLDRTIYNPKGAK
jgi:hypothetical protein